MKKILTLGTVLATTIALWACGIPEEQHKKVVAKNKQLQADLDAAKKMSAEQKQKIAALEADLGKFKGNYASALEAQNAFKAKLAATKEALKELERIKKEMEAKRRLDAKLKAEFQAMISAGQLQIVNVNGRLVIKMASKILFPSGKAKFKRRGKKALVKIGKILAKVDRHFQVAGHTDNVPIKRSRYGDNWGLSANRALQVVRLLEKNGVPGNRLSAAGFSQFNPVSTNKTKIGRRLNRRIEITLLPSIPPQVK